MKGVVIFYGQTPYPQTFLSLIPHIQTFVKPYIPIAPIADYIPNIGVCQVYFVPKSYDKFVQIWGKIFYYRNLLFKKI